MSQNSRHRSRTPPARMVHDPHHPHNPTGTSGSTYKKGNDAPTRVLGENITNQIRPAQHQQPSAYKSLSTSPLPKKIKRESYKLEEEVESQQQRAAQRHRQDPFFRDVDTSALSPFLHHSDYHLGGTSNDGGSGGGSNGVPRCAPALTSTYTRPLRPGALECGYTANGVRYAYEVAAPVDTLALSAESFSSSSLSTPVSVSSLSSLEGVSPITEVHHGRRYDAGTSTAEEEMEGHHILTPRGQKRQRRPLGLAEDVDDGRQRHHRLDDTPLVAPEVLRLLSQNTWDAIPLSDYFNTPM